jgi:outer membrane protein insertion porin family
VGGYKSDSLGTGIRFGVPIALDDRIFLGLSVDQTKIETYQDSPQQYIDFVDRFGDTNNTLLTTLGWASDKRDSATYPTSGTYRRFNTELSIPPADMRYGRMSYQWQQYFSLNRTYTLMFNSDFGFAQGYGGAPVPFYKNYYAGGIGSVRGYKDNSIGPKSETTFSDGSTSTANLGGTRRAIGSVELLFPLPGVKEKDRSARLSAFFDAGALWGVNSDFSVSDIRYSTGLALSWSSPIGPLKFSFGFPLHKKADDKTQRFQFVIGTAL